MAQQRRFVAAAGYLAGRNDNMCSQAFHADLCDAEHSLAGLPWQQVNALSPFGGPFSPPCRPASLQCQACYCEEVQHQRNKSALHVLHATVALLLRRPRKDAAASGAAKVAATGRTSPVVL